MALGIYFLRKMCICLIQFQHNSYPCNTLRTLAYGYMRYKLEVWLKITGASISIIFHKIDSREKIAQARPQPTAGWEWKKSPHTCAHPPMHIHTQAHLCTYTCTYPSADMTRHQTPQVNSQCCWLPLGGQPALLDLTGSQNPKVPGNHLWWLNQRTVQSSRNLDSEFGSNRDDHCLTLGNLVNLSLNDLEK